MERRPGSRLAEIASKQHGVISAGQPREVGLGKEAVRSWVRRGLLYRAHRGIYRVGHRAPSTEASYMAAVLACGEGAVLSGRAAAFLYGLLRGGPRAPEVTAAANRNPRGVVTHCVRRLDPSEVARYRGIPVTTVARTVEDLARILDLDDLARACHEAEVRHGLRPQTVRVEGIPEAAKLRAILRGDAHVTLSELERLFLEVLHASGLPPPRTNRRKGAHWVDCRWPAQRLTVELDGYRYHHSRHAWEPAATVADLAALLRS